MSIRQALAAAIVEFGRCVDQLATYTPDDWEDAGDEAEGLYKELERQRNRLALIDTAFLKGTATRRPRAEHKQVQWLVREFPMNAQVARARVRAAERINDAPDPATITSTNPEGTVSPQFMPAMREAVADGLLDSAGVAKVHTAINALPAQHHDEITTVADAPLANMVRQQGPTAVDGIGVHLTRLFNVEGAFTDADRNRKRSIRLGKQEYDGMTRLTGLIMPRLAAVLKRLIADHGKAGDLAARMKPAAPADSVGPEEEFTALTDPRTPEQRAHDAFEAAIADGFCRGVLPEDLALIENLSQDLQAEIAQEQSVKHGSGLISERSENSLFSDTDFQPDEVGVPDLIPGKHPQLAPRRGTTAIVAVTTLEELLAGKGNATTDGGVLTNVESIIEGADCSDLYLQVLGFEGQTLYLGRSQRLGSLAQYLALCAEEGGSSAPGTSAPPAQCDIHHVTGWNHGGETNLDNLTLVDRHTHANTIDTAGDGLDPTAPANKWQSKPGDPETGQRVRWHGPVSHDPARKPVENLHVSVQTTIAAKLRRQTREKYGIEKSNPRKGGQKDTSGEAS